MRNQYTFNSGRSVLTNDQVRLVAPSVFAERPYHKVSDKYGFIPTHVVLSALMREGWQVMQATENRVRLADKRGFSKHRLVLQHRDAKPIGGLGDTAPRICLTNGHDLSSAYILEAGFFRQICSNGLIVSTGDVGRISVRHVGQELPGRVIEGSYQIIREMGEIQHVAEGMREIELTDEEQNAYAESAAMIRWEKDAMPIDASQLLLTRRYDDRGRDLWTTYNRVQENLIRGGLRGVNSAGRRQRTRGVNSINEDTRINRALWQLAQSMAALKKAA